MDQNDFFNKFNGPRRRALKALVAYFENPTDQKTRDKVASIFDVGWDVLDVLVPPLRETIFRLAEETGDGPSFDFTIDTSLGVPAYSLRPSQPDDDEYHDSAAYEESDDDYENEYPEPTYDPDADSDEDEEDDGGSGAIPPALRELLIQLKRSFEGGSKDSDGSADDDKPSVTPKVFVLKNEEAKKWLADIRSISQGAADDSEDQNDDSDEELDDELDGIFDGDSDEYEDESDDLDSDDPDDEANEKSPEEREAETFERMRSVVQSFMCDFHASEYDKAYWDIVGNNETIEDDDEVADDGDPNAYFKTCREIRRLILRLSNVGLLDEGTEDGKFVRHEAEAGEVWKVWDEFGEWINKLVSMRVLDEDWPDYLESIYDEDEEEKIEVNSEVDPELEAKNRALNQEAELRLVEMRIARLENAFGYTFGKIITKERREQLEELRKRRYFDLDKALEKTEFHLMKEDDYHKFYRRLEETRPEIPVVEVKKDADEEKRDVFEDGFKSGYGRGVREARARMIVKLLKTFTSDELRLKEELRPLGITFDEIEIAKKWLESDDEVNDREDRLDD